MKVYGTTNTGMHVNLVPRALAEGTILSGEEPRVAIVISSEDGVYEGHIEVSPEGGNILGEELRKAAEAASKQEEN